MGARPKKNLPRRKTYNVVNISIKLLEPCLLSIHPYIIWQLLTIELVHFFIYKIRGGEGDLQETFVTRRRKKNIPELSSCGYAGARRENREGKRART